MTKEETIKIMAMLGAFYSNGKNDPKIMANAWHLILRDFDYKDAENAVIDFARNDVREYATFPAVGKIVQAIKAKQAEKMKPVREIMKAINSGYSYGRLSARAKSLIAEDTYYGWMDEDPLEFVNHQDKYMATLLDSTKMLEGR